MVGVGVPTWGRVGGGWDVWLPMYIALTFILVMGVTGWRLNLRRSLIALAGGMTWAWSVNRLGVIPAAACAVLIAIVAGVLLRRRGPARDLE